MYKSFIIILSFLVILIGFSTVHATELEQHTNIRGDAVFVHSDSVEKLLERGYLVDNSLIIETTSYDLSERWVHVPEYEGSAGVSAGTIPFYEFDFPKAIQVGKEFEINIPYSYVEYDPEDGDIDNLIEPGRSNPAIDGDIGTKFTITYPQEWVLLNDDDFYNTHIFNDYKWDRYDTEKAISIIYDPTNLHNLNFRFLLNDTINYPHNSILTYMDFSSKEYFMNLVGNNTYDISTEEIIPNFAPGTEPQPPYPNRYIGEYGPRGTIDPEKSWPDMEIMVDELENAEIDWTFDGTYKNIEEMLRADSPKAWVDEFLEKYPQYKANFILPTLNWILPEAYGQSSYFYVNGDVRIEETPNKFTVPSQTVTVCIYDKNLSRTDDYSLMSKLGGADACDEVDNGRFGIITVPTDPDNDGTTPDFVVGILLKNEDTELITTEGKSDSHAVFYSSSMNNPASFSVKFTGRNMVKMLDSDPFFKSYKIFKTTNETLDKFHDLGTRGFPVLDVIYDPTYNTNVILQYTSNTVRLTDVFSGNTPSRLISDYPVAIAHEVGHFIQDKTYKSVKGDNSRVPSCAGITGTHLPNIVTNEQCAWGEGWATFVGIMAAKTSSYKIFTTQDRIDQERGTSNGVSFPSTYPRSTEGWVTAMLWDIHDTTNERSNRNSLDNMSDKTQTIWNAFSTDASPDRNSIHIASGVQDFKDDWDAGNNPSLAKIYSLNKLTTSSIPPSYNTVIFTDTFGTSLNKWDESGEPDWQAKIPDEAQVPNKPRNNKVAHADNCDRDCIITIKNSVDLSPYSNVDLSFWRFVDRSADRDEGLRLEISSNNAKTWSQIGLWTDNTNHDDDTWHKETISLDSYLNNGVKIRFIAQVSSSAEDIAVDDVLIQGT